MPEAFISYVREDEQSARQLQRALEERGVAVKSVDRLAPPGTSWVSALLDAIKSSDLFLVLLSKETEKSKWVSSEIALALSEAARGGHVRVVPVLLDEKAPIPFFLRHIQVLDLSRPEAFQGQVDSLVRSLDPERVPARDRQHELEAQLDYLKAERQLFEQEITAHESRRAAWTSPIAGAVAALAAVVGVITGLLSISDRVLTAVKAWGLPFAAGVVVSLLGFVLSAWIRRRVASRRLGRE